MKILIVDNANKNRGFSDALKQHAEIKIKNSGFETLNFENCKIIFKHDTFNHDINAQKQNIIFIEFTGGDSQNIILDESDGYKFRAKIESPSQINNVLAIIDNDELTREDLEMILNFDSKLEDLLKPFSTYNPFETKNKEGKVLKDAKKDLCLYLKSKGKVEECNN